MTDFVGTTFSVSRKVLFIWYKELRYDLSKFQGQSVQNEPDILSVRPMEVTVKNDVLTTIALNVDYHPHAK